MSDGTSPAAVRNYGANVARFDYLAFIDGDCVAPKNWLFNAVSLLDNNNSYGLVGGGCLAPINSNLLVRSWAITEKETNDLFVKTKINKFLSGSNMIMRKSDFDRVGGFDESLVTGEDDAFSRKIINSGFVTFFSSLLSVVHYGYPDNMIDVFKKSFWHGKSQFQAHGFWGDKMVILTWGWILMFLLSFFSYVNHYFSFFFLIFLFFPIVLSRRRLVGLNTLSFLRILPVSYVVCFIALLGRSLSLVKELTRCTLKTTFR